MPNELEKAQIMFKLARKNNWGACYDRLEHFKRFENLKDAVKELANTGWVIIHKKPKFIGISLDSKFKREIVVFVELYLPNVKGFIQ